MRNIKPLLAALAITVFAAGCGDSGEAEEGVTTASLSKAQFIKAADEICIKDSREVVKLMSQYDLSNSVNSTEQVETAIGTVILPALEKRVERIRALGAPGGEEGLVEEFLNSMQEGLDTAREQSASSMEELQEVVAPGFQPAQEYGLRVCAGGA